MSTYFDLLPIELTEIIYQKKHQMEMQKSFEYLLQDCLTIYGPTEYFDEMDQEWPSSTIVRTKNNKKLTRRDEDGNYNGMFWERDEWERERVVAMGTPFDLDPVLKNQIRMLLGLE